jgi:hypothetical protein
MLTETCSLVSRRAGESLLGTAPLVENWFLLEAEGPFGAQAFEDSRIAESVQIHVKKVLARTKNSKLLLIRNNQTDVRDGIRFVVGRTGEPNVLPTFSEYRLPSYEDLLQFGDSLPEETGAPILQPILLVCTNGRRDTCCALHGLPTFQRLSSFPEVRVFECSHVGQHRFAPNIVALPQSAYYGRVAVEEADELIAHIQNDLLYLPRLRGRTIYSPAGQAAEAFLRGLPGLISARLSLTDIQLVDDETWRVTFRTDNGEHTLTLRYKQDNEIDLRSSCASDKTHHPGEFTVLEHGQALA